MEFRGVYFTPEEVDAMQWLVENEQEMRQVQPNNLPHPSLYSSIPVPTDDSLSFVLLKLTLMPDPDLEVG